jgi:hypothetical protein
MPDIAEILRTNANGWLYLPIAVQLGALYKPSRADHAPLLFPYPER